MNTIHSYIEAAQTWYAANPFEGKIATLALVVVLGAIAYYVAKLFIQMGIRLIVRKSATSWDDKIFDSGAFNRLAHIAPGLVILAFAEPLPGDTDTIQRLVNAYLTMMAISLVNRLLNAINEIYSESEISRTRPIKGYLQIVKLFLFLAGGLVVLALLMNKSPVVFVSGLGAMTAVLLLVFRDTILSFVASIQIAGNDMVRIGDWIEMPKFGADGDVIDIALHTIKVQNWDKTITTIPTHALIQDSFKNWRGMSEAGGRRIARAIAIDANSVEFLDDAAIGRLEKVEALREYLPAKKTELDEHNENIDASNPVNQRRMTNIGTFRKYLLEYLKRRPDIHKDMTLLVRQLAPTTTGVPIQLYCFTTTTAWSDYEGIQGDIFDHILATMPQFGLRAFQEPSGADVRALKG